MHKNGFYCIEPCLEINQLIEENKELKNKNESIHSIADGLQKRNHYLTQENERYIQCINEIDKILQEYHPLFVYTPLYMIDKVVRQTKEVKE